MYFLLFIMNDGDDKLVVLPCDYIFVLFCSNLY
jgi:hypothetical protein